VVKSCVATAACTAAAATTTCDAKAATAPNFATPGKSFFYYFKKTTRIKIK
jgi:hypothetical protein